MTRFDVGLQHFEDKTEGSGFLSEPEVEPQRLIMEMNENVDSKLDLTESFKYSMVSDDADELLSNAAELGLDSFLEDGLFKDIPLFSTVVSVFKIGNGIKEYSYRKKLAIFLKGLRDGNIDPAKQKRHIIAFENDKKTRTKEIEYILVLLDRLIQETRAEHLAKFYLAYLEGKISESLFYQCSEVLDRLLLDDEKCLRQDVLDNIQRDSMLTCALRRLQGLGLVTPNEKPKAFDVDGNPLVYAEDSTFKLTEFGTVVSDILFGNK